MVVTEASLRARLKGQKGHTVTLPAGAILTPAAKQFARDHGLTVVTDLASGGQAGGKAGGRSRPGRPDGKLPAVVGVVPELSSGDGQSAKPPAASAPSGVGRAGRRDQQQGFYCRECGGFLAAKPEHYTHLHDNVLVPKTHPRIALRGKLDNLGAWLLDSQVLARQAGHPQLADDLGQLLDLVRTALKAEVAGEPLPPLNLIGMDSEGLRRESHARWLEVTSDHGPVPVRLNLLRTLVRETELVANQAFCGCGDGPPERSDLLTALNRLSSAVYVLLLRFVDGKYGPPESGR